MTREQTIDIDIDQAFMVARLRQQIRRARRRLVYAAAVAGTLAVAAVWGWLR